MKIPEMIPPPIKSNAVKTVGYDKDNFMLYIQFNTGVIYSYSDVNAGQYEKLMKAPSIGSHIAKEITPNHFYQKLDLDSKKQ